MQKKLITLVLLGASVALLAGCVSNKEEAVEEDTTVPMVEETVPSPEEVVPEEVPAPEAPALPEEVPAPEAE